MAICIVDDSLISRAVVKKALINTEFDDVIEATDGVDALQKVSSTTKKIDLFILDVNMPKMDGITLTKELRKTDKSTPIIILTSDHDEDKKKQALSYGATGWILKPVKPEKLLKLIQYIYEKKKQK